MYTDNRVKNSKCRASILGVKFLILLKDHIRNLEQGGYVGLWGEKSDEQPYSLNLPQAFRVLLTSDIIRLQIVL